jgi:glycosyltransferase involved in cell wall biosynthesis
MNRAYDRSDRLVLLSQSFVGQYAEICRTKDLERLRAIPNPVPPIEDVSASGKERCLLFVGRLQESVKRLRLILAAWERLSGREGNRDWKLVVVGDGPDRDAVRGWASGLERVSLEGFRDPTPYYQRASLFAMTSAFEGFGMTLVEAQQNGVVPVVMDSFLSLRDIVADRENGRIVPDGDVDAFVDTLQELMDDPAELRRLADRARATSRRFDTSSVADQWEKLFAEVLRDAPH